MLETWKTEDGKLCKIQSPQPGCWIRLISPDGMELARAAKSAGLDPGVLESPLDLSEMPGAKVQKEYARILIDVPILEKENSPAFQTLPLGIVLSETAIITISARTNQILEHMIQDKTGTISTSKPLGFLNELLSAAARCYQEDLHHLDAVRKEVETRAGEQVAKNDLITLHEVETSLIWFGCSLKENVKALEQFRSQLSSSRFSSEQDKLEEAEVEMNQAASMTDMYREIAAAARDLMADLADNRLNNVMKFLTSMTLVLAVPTIVSGFYGMNVNEDSIPLAALSHSFLIIVVLTLILTAALIVILKKKKML